MHSPVNPPEIAVVASPPNAGLSPALVWTMLALFLLNTMNYVDRLLFSVAQEAIKTDLRLSDFELGLLGGPAFALLYTVFSFPIARIADRGHRVTIISVSLGLWSAMTAFCGAAASFVQMLIGRAAVSIGEAGCTPAAHSLISDAFPAARRTTAISIFAAAGPVGALTAAVAGGALIAAHGWRMTFILCGVIGAVLAVAFRLTVREPRRTVQASRTGLLPTIRLLLGRRSFAAIAVGGGIAGIGSYSNQQYMVSFLMRAHGLPIGTASALMGLVIGGVGIFMTLMAGPLMDRSQARFPRIRTWMPAVGLAWSGVLYATAFQVPVVTFAIPLLVLASMGQHFYMPAMYSLGQDIAPPRMRAMASAIIIAASSVLGYGLGPPLIGFMSDALAHAATAADAGDCARVATAACAAASAHGLRLSLSFGSCFFIAAAALFALAGRWVRDDIAAR